MNSNINLSNLLEESAKKYSSKIAIEDFLGNEITYKELSNASKNINFLLLKYNIGAGCRVGILASKSIDVVSFIFGILKTQAAYISIDSSAPPSRNNLICNDCELQAIFIEKKLLTDFVREFYSENAYTEERINETYSLLIVNKQKQIHTEPLAYIIYTSGSTGIPKGVKHTHNSALTFINWASEIFNITSADRFLSIAPFHFDLSMFDIFTSISLGATLILSTEKMGTNPMLFAQYLSQKEITVLYSTPSALSYLAAFGKMNKHTYKNLHTILFAGEVFPIKQLNNLKEELPQTIFYNLYGPTETNVCTWFKIPAKINNDKNDPYPIGKPCNYASYKILSTSEENEGELLIAGNSLMAGYWNDDEKTKLSIETDANGIAWYKTGDIVNVNENGDLVYLRRKDRMVKRNGYRIELNEIEKNILTNQNIIEVAVTASSPNNQTNTIITAHLVWIENNKLSTLELLNYCSTVLPNYMLPDNFKFYSQLPKTSTHKIDYKQLQNLQND